MNNNIVLSKENDSHRALIDKVCEFTEYLECLGTAQSECITYMKDSIESCPEHYKEDFDIYLLDPVCITDTFIDNTKVSDKKATSCDSLWTDEMEKMKINIMPNKNIKFTPAAKSAASVGTVANAPAPYVSR